MSCCYYCQSANRFIVSAGSTPFKKLDWGEDLKSSRQKKYRQKSIKQVVGASLMHLPDSLERHRETEVTSRF